MNKFTLIPSAQQYKSAPANDQEISISLEEKQQELTEYDRSSTVSLADVYDSERQGCTIFRPTFKISYLYGNVITGTTEYLPFKNNLFYVGADASIQNNVWKGIPKTQRDLLSIQRKVDVNEKMYVYLLERRANTIIARAGILPQTSVIETAHSVGVVKPNKRKISYSFLFVGLILSLLVVFIRTVVFATIEIMDELKRLTHLPVLGEIILSKEATDNYLIVDKDVKAPITESFRAIRTNLEYFANEVNSKAVLVTSYNPGEGKTFCSVNLAAIIAKAGKRVLLIELDLHKPKIQQALKMSSDVGVSSILIGKSSIESTVMETQIENMSVILSGPTPPNASELILSKHLKEIIDYGKAHFDYVIVDTAPIGLITDALVIMKNVDVSLFVLNTKFAKKQILDVVHDISKANKVSNIGLILNGVKRNRSKYYYNYGYGSGYGYGYGGYGKSGKK